MAQYALRFYNVSAGYRHHNVLDDLSFSLQQGEFVSLIGPNGCGKSTLLKTASALLKPLSGSVELFGRNIQQIKPAERATLLGVVPQKLETPMAFSVHDYMVPRVNFKSCVSRILERN